jgi:hypothetical protein
MLLLDKIIWLQARDGKEWKMLQNNNFKISLSPIGYSNRENAFGIIPLQWN